jgi:hypothetical protein
MAEQQPPNDPGLDAANIKALEKVREQRKASGGSQQAAPQVSQATPQQATQQAAPQWPAVPPNQQPPPWKPPDRTPTPEACMATAPEGTVQVPKKEPVPAPEPLPPATAEERAEYEAALAKVQLLQGKVWQHGPPPANVPMVQTLRKYRVRLEGVTVKAGKDNALVRYLRNLREIVHPIHPHIVLPCPDGADVVDAYSPGEAYEKFKRRFNIRKSEHQPMFCEVGSPDDERAFEAEKRGEVYGTASMSA